MLAYFQASQGKRRSYEEAAFEAVNTPSQLAMLARRKKMSQLEKSANEQERKAIRERLRARIVEEHRRAATALSFADLVWDLEAAGATEEQLAAFEKAIAEAYRPDRSYTLEELQKITDEMNAAMRHANTLGRR